MAATPKIVLALDYGATRTGVAIVSSESRLPRPLTTLRAEDFFESLNKLIERENVTNLVVGLPRGIEGQRTAQTEAAEAFVSQLQAKFSLPVDTQDEAVTSKKAEAELDARGKPYKQEDIDALAATYILDDWLLEHKDMG